MCLRDSELKNAAERVCDNYSKLFQNYTYQRSDAQRAVFCSLLRNIVILWESIGECFKRVAMLAQVPSPTSEYGG